VPVQNGLAHIYLHYDGYPENVLPALNALTAEHGVEKVHGVLLQAKEVRSVSAIEVEGFPEPRAYEVHAGLDRYFPYNYQHLNGEWRLV